MDSRVKTITIISVILILVAILAIFGLKYGKPNHQLSDEFKITIKGKIFSSEDDYDKLTRPDVVRVYHSYYLLNNLCEADITELANISWNDDEGIGDYIITFSLPVEEEIIITPNCNGCLHERVYVSRVNNSKNVDLKWDTSTCREEKERFDDQKKASERATNLLDSADSDLSRSDFNNSIRESIKKDITNGRDEVGEANRLSDKNLSLFHAEFALFYAWKAKYKLGGFEVGECLEKVNFELESRNSSCYITPYQGLEDYKSSSSRFTSFLNQLEFLDRKTYGDNERKKVQSGIDGLFNDKQHMRKAYWDCQDSLRSISKSFEHQENYCERREITFSIINWVAVTIALIVGLILGKFGRRWNK